MRLSPRSIWGLAALSSTASETAKSRAACPIDGVAVAVDPEHEAVSTRVDGRTDARQISANGDAVWVGFREGCCPCGPGDR